MRGKDLIAATLFGGSGGGGIPQADIDAAFAALAEKGVTVPDDATSADLDDLIASIVTGGGGKMAIGTITVAEETHMNNAAVPLNVVHNLGVIPRGVAFFRDTTDSLKSKTRIAINASIIAENMYYANYLGYYGDYSVHIDTGNFVYEAFVKAATETQMTINYSSSSKIGGYTPAGSTITWITWA